jgi:hypothetical protein
VKRNVIFGLSVASLVTFAGCYTTEMLTAEGLKAKAEPVDITVFMKDSYEYRFAKENYRIAGDTLSGYGIRKRNLSTDVVLHASCALAECDSIEGREFDLARTVSLCAGAGAVAFLLVHILWTSHSQNAAAVGIGYSAP